MKPCVIWITGLSGAGKSTLSKEIVNLLRRIGKYAILLDGDELREVLFDSANRNQNHGREERLNLAMKYSRLCRFLSKQGFIVVISTISLFKEIHAWNRINLPNYFEIYLKVPIDELRRRDPKEIYRRFDTGRISNVVGLDLPFDEPLASDWTVNFNQSLSPTIISKELINKLQEKELI